MRRFVAALLAVALAGAALAASGPSTSRRASLALEWRLSWTGGAGDTDLREQLAAAIERQLGSHGCFASATELPSGESPRADLLLDLSVTSVVEEMAFGGTLPQSVSPDEPHADMRRVASLEIEVAATLSAPGSAEPIRAWRVRHADRRAPRRRGEDIEQELRGEVLDNLAMRIRSSACRVPDRKLPLPA